MYVYVSILSRDVADPGQKTKAGGYVLVLDPTHTAEQSHCLLDQLIPLPEET